MVILGVQVLKHGSEVGMRIGNPVQLSDTQQQNNSAPAAPIQVMKPTIAQNKMQTHTGKFFVQ